ncbi:hypothetical protein [Taibaiella koreensis]|uniref:hypothetical protein n=1 Tax=Taibaiella koreensis TaxID=1268548 RepID=UPI0013C2FFE8|nr:hypothetical protein [Taibaiella koreensis]
MDDYLGFPQLQHVEQEAPRALPQVDIDGTLFFADIQRHEFRQVDNAGNRMTMGSIKEEMGFSHFLYDTQTKNLYLGNIEKTSAIPDHVRIIIVPPLRHIDPDGLAQRQGYKAAKQIERPPVQLTALASNRKKTHKPKRY